MIKVFIASISNKNYRKQRNHVNKAKKKSVQNYFFERCVGGPKSSDFWPTIKPFLSKKGSSSNNHITLSENGEIINDPAKVSEVFQQILILLAKHLLDDNFLSLKYYSS
jgi:hypothetical protein